jgi:sensor histidine kinase YesM
VRALGFPPLLLITLVENAIKHGIEPKPGPGRIDISAVRDGDLLQVTVADDGRGLQPGVGGGLGLVNLRAQLDTLYAGRATFELRSDPARGARAELRIPVGDRA